MSRTNEEMSARTEPDRRRWLVLGLVCAAFFMTVLTKVMHESDCDVLIVK